MNEQAPHPHAVRDLQRSRNRGSQAAWDDFEAHRRRVTALLCGQVADWPTGPHRPRLLVLGAGNCNDLDLATLLTQFAEIQLIDLDEAAVQSGVRRQLSQNDPRLRIDTPRDITGVADLLADWAPDQPPPESQLAACIRQAARAPLPAAAARFDVVVSTCVLSQIVDSVCATLGQRHPAFLPLISQLRLRHLEQLVGCAAPGGTVLLVTDVVSSLSAPELASVPEQRLAEHLLKLIRQGNFFTGLNPLVLANLFRKQPGLTAVVDRVQLWDPWLWKLGSRCYAVCALQARRRPTTDGEPAPGRAKHL